ncbi:MAG: UDP-N-acetylmuramate dehydrogenase [Planctomycetota bacterium]
MPTVPASESRGYSKVSHGIRIEGEYATQRDATRRDFCSGLRGAMATSSMPDSGVNHESIEVMLHDLDVEAEANAPLAPLTWYRLGGRADWLVTPRSPAALQCVMKRCRESGVPFRVMGSGANLLVADEGVRGIVIRLSDAAFRQVSTIHRHRRNRGGDGRPGDGLRIMAGAQMERLVMNMAMQGMAGLECMAGIPSTLGGAVRMNAGGRYGSIADIITAVGCLGLDGEPQVYARSEIEFGYRRCSLIEPVILWAEVRLTPDDPKEVHSRVKDIFRYKKQTQPMGEHSAGCVFKNPARRPGQAGQIESGTGKTDHNSTANARSGGDGRPDAADASIRESAGRLIDTCGLKGYSIGGAAVSEKHANFLVTRSGCTATDMMNLIEHIVRVVREETGYELERELVVWR